MSHGLHADKRKEKFFKLAKEQGYRSRAAFKLIQLNKKFNFLSNSRACIDLCAAPGGWLQIAGKYMPVNSMVIGVDILPIKPLPNVTTFVEDITTPQCRSTLKKQLHGWHVDLVLHDGAPSVGGGAAWVKDAYVQTELVLHSLKLATEFLTTGGTFVTKIFRSPDYMALTWVLKQFFQKVHVTKPDASRGASSEVFAVCQGYLAPKKIDPRMFDPAHVFKRNVDEETANNKVLNVLKGKISKKIRVNKDGYEDDASTILHKSAGVTQYLDAANPSDVLAKYNDIVFLPQDDIYKAHTATTTEVLELMKDLKVLGKGDFAQLIKWHKKLNLYRKELQDAANEVNMDDEEVLEEEEDVEVDVEALREQELDDLSSKLARKARIEQKKKHAQKMKDVKKLALNAQQLKERIIDSDDEELFNLKSLKNDEMLQKFRKVNGDGLSREKFLDIISNAANDFEYSGSEAEDNGDEGLSFEQLREKQMDTLYEEYKKRKNIVTKNDKKKMKKQVDEEKDSFLAEVSGDENAMNSDDEELDALQKAKDQYNKEKVDIKGYKDGRKDETATAQRWFAQDMFADIDIDDDAEQNMRKQLQNNKKDLAAEAKKKKAAVAAKQSMNHTKRARPDDDSDGDDESDDMNDSDDEYAPVAVVNKKKVVKNIADNSDTESEDESDKSDDDRWLGDVNDKDKERQKKYEIKQMAALHVQKAKMMGVGGGNKGIEEVPLSDYSDDSDARAQIIALGTKMLRRKDKNALVEAAYNRYSYNDADELPDWFVEDESRYHKSKVPISKEEFDKWKNYYKAIDARPIRRLAEAAARKKKGAIRKLERAKVRAGSIFSQEGVGQEEKLKQVDKLLRSQRAQLKEKVTKVYSVSTRAGQTHEMKSNPKGKSMNIRVDRRMKKDKKGAARAAWRNEHKGKRK